MRMSSLFSLLKENHGPSVLRIQRNDLKIKDLVQEIKRRAALHSIPVPRARNWRQPKLVEWLEVNPVRDATDIDFP